MIILLVFNKILGCIITHKIWVINWVNWDDVCKLKKMDGLAVCDMRLVNLALLGKWRWRLLSGTSDI